MLTTTFLLFLLVCLVLNPAHILGCDDYSRGY